MSIMPGGFFDREDGKSFADPKQKELLEKVMDSFPRCSPSEESSDSERLQAFVRIEKEIQVSVQNGSQPQQEDVVAQHKADDQTEPSPQTKDGVVESGNKESSVQL